MLIRFTVVMRVARNYDNNAANRQKRIKTGLIMLSGKGERHEHTVPEFWRVPSKETHGETNHASENGGDDRDYCTLSDRY